MNTTTPTESIPHISMSHSAHYVTQTSVYSSPRLGPLTNRRISHYIRQGYYGEAAKRREIAKEKVRQKKILAEFVLE